MRTNIVLDDRLVRKAMRATGLTTKRAVVQAGLELLVALQEQTEIRVLRDDKVLQVDPGSTQEGAPKPGRRTRAAKPGTARGGTTGR